MSKKSKKVDTRQGGLTWDIEMKFKHSFVKKIPNFLSPHRLTYIAFIGSILAGLSYYLTSFSKWWLISASFFIIVQWFGDLFDGTVARHRGLVQERYGYYADHMFDMVSILVVAMGLGLSSGMNIIWALGVIAGYFLIAINTFLVAHTRGKFKVAPGLFGPTEFRIGIIILNTVSLFFRWPLNLFKIDAMTFTLIDVLAIIFIIVLAFLFIKEFLENLAYLNKIDSKNYKEMTIQEAIKRIDFKIQNSEFGKTLKQENLDKEIGKFFNTLFNEKK